MNVYFAVENCDEAATRATERGGTLHFGPITTPFGRFAALSDPQGANFSVIDVTTLGVETPGGTDVPNG